MKLKKIIATLALPLMALFTSCEQDLEMETRISTDKSTYEVEATGGNVVVKLLATQDWKAVVSPSTSLDEVDDITVEPESGSASSSIVEVTVKVPENKGYDRKANISFLGATVSGAVTIEQKGAQGERLLTCTIAEFLAKPVDASVYYILTGEVTNSTTPTTYSNFTLRDPKTGDEVLIFGLAYKDDVSNQKVGLLSKEGIEEGDEITIASTRGEYNGTIEGINSYYISHKKSESPMIKLGSTEVTAAKGSTFDLAVSSNLVTWTLSSNVSWLTFEPATGDKSATVVVTVAEDGEGDEGVITLSAEGLESVTCKVTRTDIMDITIADFLTAEVSDKPYRITAKIESIANDTYGNLYAQDGTGRVYVYGLTATKVDKNDKSFASLELREGDIITFVGTRGRYDDAKVEDQKEQVSGAYLEVSYKSTDVTISEFLTKEVASKYLESPYYRLTGIVKEIVKEEYGNIYLKEENSDTFVYVYGITKAPVAKNDKSFASLGVKVGDKLTIVGQRGQYASAKDENQKEQVANAYFISVEAGDAPLPPVEDDLTVENATVEVEADATSASFTVKSNLDWTVSKVEGEWITSFTESGSKDGTIAVEFAANEGEARSAKFTVKGGEKSVELTLTQKAAAAGSEYSTFAEIIAALNAGSEDSFKAKDALVVASGNGRIVVKDDTGIMFIYSKAATCKVGDVITLEGEPDLYDGCPEWYAPTITVTGTKDVVYPEPKVYDEAALTAYASAPVIEYAKIDAVKEGSSIKVGSQVVYPQSSIEIPEGEITLYGYTIGYSSKYNNTSLVVVKVDLRAIVSTINVFSTASVNVGETVSLDATTNSSATLKYESADETIATVSAEGVVTGVKEGTTEIIVSVPAEGVYTEASAKVTITVKPAGTISEDKYFVKVTETPTDWSGTYLIVCEDQKAAFDGSLEKLDAVNNYKEVEVAGGKILATDDLKKITFVINGTNKSLKAASGKYIGNDEDKNALTSSDTELVNEFSLDTDFNFVVKSKGGAYLRFNSASNQMRFRYYKSKSYTNQTAIQLYKLED